MLQRYDKRALLRLCPDPSQPASASTWRSIASRVRCETSEGPASRVQWGVSYVEGLIRLNRGDETDKICARQTDQAASAACRGWLASA